MRPCPELASRSLDFLPKSDEGAKLSCLTADLDHFSRRHFIHFVHFTSIMSGTRRSRRQSTWVTIVVNGPVKTQYRLDELGRLVDRLPRHPNRRLHMLHRRPPKPLREAKLVPPGRHPPQPRSPGLATTELPQIDSDESRKFPYESEEVDNAFSDWVSGWTA
jgi:hypothetical protein